MPTSRNCSVARNRWFSPVTTKGSAT
jgi:hypothetical protein